MDADPLGRQITNPQSLNRYALNNPTTLTDPLGLALGDLCTVESASLANCPPTTITVSGVTIYNSAEWNYFNSLGNYYSTGTHRRAPFQFGALSARMTPVRTSRFARSQTLHFKCLMPPRER